MEAEPQFQDRGGGSRLSGGRKVAGQMRFPAPEIGFDFRVLHDIVAAKRGRVRERWALMMNMFMAAILLASPAAVGNPRNVPGCWRGLGAGWTDRQADVDPRETYRSNSANRFLWLAIFSAAANSLAQLDTLDQFASGPLEQGQDSVQVLLHRLYFRRVGGRDHQGRLRFVCVRLCLERAASVSGCKKTGAWIDNSDARGRNADRTHCYE